MSAIACELLRTDSRLPMLVRPVGAGADLAAVLRERRVEFDTMLLEHGAILFRDFALHDVADFENAVGEVSSERLRYTNRSTPRTPVGKGVFSATEYPAKQEIPPHCENAYQREWPQRLALCCLLPAATGGNTPIADMRRVTAAIPPEIVRKFETRGVKYVRHYRPHVDIPWQTAFQTESRDELAAYCASHGIVHRWLDEETLRTEHVCQGTARHPKTGETVFFNQAHLFHHSSLPQAVAASLIEIFGADGLPRNAYFGDGEEIPLDDLETIRACHRRELISFPWRKADMLLLDNMQVAHGREAFRGDRRVLASLMDAFSDERRS